MAKTTQVATPVSAKPKAARKPAAAATKLQAPKDLTKAKQEAPAMALTQADAPKPTSPFVGEKHGVKPPVRQGNCMDVWLKCSELVQATEADAQALPSVKDVQAALPNANPNNVQIEVYRWRKWHGIRGRQAYSATPDAT